MTDNTRARTGWVVLVAALPLGFTFVAALVTALALGGRVGPAVRDGGPVAFAVIGLTGVAVTALSLLLAFRTRGIAIPPLLVGLPALLPWVTGLVGTMIGFKQTAAALNAVASGEKVLLLVAGTAEANACALFGYAFASALMGATGIGLGIASLTQPAARPRGTGALVGAVLALPALWLCFKGSGGAGLLGMLLPGLGAMAFAISSALALLGATDESTSGAPGPAVVAALWGALAALAGLGAREAVGIHSLGHLMAMAEPAERARWFGVVAAEAVATHAHPRMLLSSLALPALAALALAVYRRRLPVTAALGVAGAAVFAALCLWQASATREWVNVTATSLTQPPWSGRTDFLPLRDCGYGPTDVDALATVAGLEVGGAPAISFRDAERLAAALRRVPQPALQDRFARVTLPADRPPKRLKGILGVLSNAAEEEELPLPLEPSPELGVAVDSRLTSASLRALLNAASQAGFHRLRLIGAGPELDPALAQVADRSPLIHALEPTLCGSQPFYLPDALPEGNPRSRERFWAGVASPTGVQLAGEGHQLQLSEADTAGANRKKLEAFTPQRVYLDMSSALTPKLLSAAANALDPSGWTIVVVPQLPEVPEEAEQASDPTKDEVPGLGMEDVRRVVHAHQNELRLCYESALERDANLHGKLMLSLLIDTVGRVSKAEAKSSSLGPRVDQCVLKRARGWRFAKATRTTEVLYPLIFDAAGR